MPRPDSLPVRILLTSLVAFGPLSTDLYLPSLPALVGEFSSDIATVQLTLSVFLIGFAAAQLAYGPLSDRFGRRPVLIGGILVYLAASLACAMASDINHLILARLAQAVGACGGPVVARAIVRDLFERERAATVLAYMAMAMATAPALAPMLGGVLTEMFGWRANFVVLAVIALAVWTATALMLSETNRHRDPRALEAGRLFSNYAGLLTSRAYIGFALTSACAYSGIFAFISGSSFVLIDRLHLPPAIYGLSFGAVVLGFIAGGFLAGRLSIRLGVDRMIRAGTLVSAAGGLIGAALAAAGVLNVAAIVGPMFVFILGTGLTMPNAMAGAVGPYPSMAGLASALLGFLQMTVAATVGIAVGRLYDGTSLPMMGAVGAVAVAGMLSYRLFAEASPQAPTGGHSSH